MRFAGRDITHRFKSVREASAYAIVTMRGPQHRRQSWGEPRMHGDKDAGSVVRAFVRGNLGYEPGSDEWRAWERWALEGDSEPAWVRKSLRPLLGGAGLLDDQPEAETVELSLEDVVWQDDDGTEYHTVREVR